MCHCNNTRVGCNEQCMSNDEDIITVAQICSLVLLTLTHALLWLAVDGRTAHQADG